MNILRGIFQKSGLLTQQFRVFEQKSLTLQLHNTMIAERKNKVPTHRDQFLPFTMNNIWDNPGAKKVARRLGRGVGSSKGKTAGKGTKGQRSRAGGSIHPRFEGGQSSIVRRLPKMGVSIRNRQRPIYINLNKIIYYVNMGRLDPSKTITMKCLHEAGVFNTATFGVKILARGAENLNFPLNIQVTDASEGAIKAIKENGGNILCQYKTRLLMREAIHPEKFPFKLRDPLPASRVVRHMERIRERGAEVEYRVPEWMQEELKERKEIEEENKKQENKFEIPIRNEPGSGKTKIRKRKPVIWRTIEYGL